MGPKALNFIHSFARKSLTKGQGSGITKIPGRMEAEAKASEIASTLVDAGLDFNKMDDFIRSEADVAKYLNILESLKQEQIKARARIRDRAAEKAIEEGRAIPADSPRGKEITEALFGKRGTVVDMQGNVIPEGSGIMGGKSIDDLMKSGDVTKGTVTKKSKKVADRDMFRAANERLNRPTSVMSVDKRGPGFAGKEYPIKQNVNSIIKQINSMEPIDAMKEANKIIKREGPYKNLNEKQAKKILEDTEDHIFERNIKPKETDVPTKETEDEVTKAYIDAVRKGKFKGTEDQFRDMIDRMMDEDFASGGRVGLAGGMTRRAFLKLMGGVAAGIGALKSGIIGAGKKGATKKVVKEVIKTPPVQGKPEWFDALVNKVILEGDDVTKKLATKDREIVHTKKLNDQESVTVTQDLDEGAIRVEYDSPTNMGEEPVVLQYKQGMADESTKGKPSDTFEVAEAEPRYVGGPEDTDIEFVGESGGPDISYLESDLTNLKTFATDKGPTMKEFVKSKKRKDLVKKVNESNYDAAEYIGGKYGDVPEAPDYDYASGGRVGLFLGGGLTAGKGVLKQIFKNLGQQRNIPGSKVLQILNPKAYQKFLNDPRLYGKFDMESGLMASDKVKQMIKETEIARMDQLERLIGLVKTGRASEKNKQELIESAMKVGGVSKQEAEMLVDALSRSAGELRSPVPRGVSDEALLEMEQMYKNLKTKDRPANANGGIAYMLGE